MRRAASFAFLSFKQRQDIRLTIEYAALEGRSQLARARMSMLRKYGLDQEVLERVLRDRS